MKIPIVPVLSAKGFADYNPAWVKLPTEYFENKTYGWGTDAQEFKEKETKEFQMKIFAPQTGVTPRTQKVLGVMASHFDSAVKSKIDMLFPNTIRPEYVIIQEAGHILDALEFHKKYRTKGDTFLRFCPESPQHGFIDSFRIDRAMDIRNVRKLLMKCLDDLFKIDKNGELLLMPFIDSSMSAIVSSGRISIGPGHDGATTGKNSSTFFVKPLSFISDAIGTLDVGGKKLVAEGEEPYIEYVFSGKTLSPHITQIRSGPKIKNFSGKLYCSSSCKIDGSILCDDFSSLLSWQNICSENGKLRDKGLPVPIILHPNGNVLSHYSAHAILNDLPIYYGTIEEFTATHGSFPTKILATTKKSPPDKEAFLCGLTDGLAVEIHKNVAMATKAAFCATHMSAQLEGNQSYYVGLGASVLFRVASALCCGERRHKKSGSKEPFALSGLTRDQIYKEVLSKPSILPELLIESTRSFLDDSWGGGYGGLNWGKCAINTISLGKSIIDEIDTKAGDVAKIATAMHALVNCMHNGGPLFNKVIPSSLMDNMAKGDLRLTLDSVISLYSYKIEEKANSYLEDALSPVNKALIKEGKFLEFWDGEKFIIPPALLLKKEEKTIQKEVEVKVITYGPPEKIYQWRPTGGGIRMQAYVKATKDISFNKKIIDVKVGGDTSLEGVPSNIATLLGVTSKPKLPSKECVEINGYTKASGVGTFEHTVYSNQVSFYDKDWKKIGDTDFFDKTNKLYTSIKSPEIFNLPSAVTGMSTMYAKGDVVQRGSGDIFFVLTFPSESGNRAVVEFKNGTSWHNALLEIINTDCSLEDSTETSLPLDNEAPQEDDVTPFGDDTESKCECEICQKAKEMDNP